MVSWSRPQVQVPLAELLAALDDQLALLELRPAQLALLSEAMLERDEPATERLLGEIQCALALQAQADARLGRARQDLAGALGVECRQVTLTNLAARLVDGDAQAVRARKDRIAPLARKLQAQHLKTSLLLEQCARLNRLLLEALFPAAAGLTTYRPGGSAGTPQASQWAAGLDTWRCDAGLMDSRR